MGSGYNVLTAWYNLLNGHLSVPVYKTSSDSDENHVLLRFESESNQMNHSAYLRDIIIICEVITFHRNTVETKTAWEILEDIHALVYSSPAEFNLAEATVYNIDEAGTSELIEGGSNPIIYRLIKRFLNQIKTN